jgi:hypothetical protein
MITPRVSPTPAFRTMKDGREICSNTAAGRREYQARREAMWFRDSGICCLCKQPMSLIEATFEHLNGRGAGGGKRDDRMEPNAVSHYFGNQAKGSISLYRWLEKPLHERIRLCLGR